MLEGIYFFIIGAFMGWVFECVFKFFSKKFETTPGILNTPFCILYGLGTVVLSQVVNRITDNIWILFILSMTVLTAMEYVTFVLLKSIYKVQLWDYKDMTFSINEKVCLEFALIWGVLGALYIKYLLPIFENFFVLAQGAAFTFALQLLLAIVIVDFIYSSYILIIKKRTVELEKDIY